MLRTGLMLAAVLLPWARPKGQPGREAEPTEGRILLQSEGAEFYFRYAELKHLK